MGSLLCFKKLQQNIRNQLNYYFIPKSYSKETKYFILILNIYNMRII